jgi:CheY-like chemotaxis protein
VLLNLYVNAADAMPRGGELRLGTSYVTEEHLANQAYQPGPGKFVLLTVKDTGLGMNKETQDRIFDPFFTTKEMGHGTGLGLASTYGIVKNHGGTIDVDSKKGVGTTFSIYLPVSEKPIEKQSIAEPKLHSVHGTILMVDDEDLVLGTGVAVLKKLGYTVLEATSGKKAIEIFDAKNDEIDLVILDMVMPGTSGGQAYDRMKEINPNVRVLLSSGYSLDSEAKEILARGCDGFIQKPFSMDELSRAIREILESR